MKYRILKDTGPGTALIVDPHGDYNTLMQAVDSLRVEITYHVEDFPKTVDFEGDKYVIREIKETAIDISPTTVIDGREIGPGRYALTRAEKVLLFRIWIEEIPIGVSS